MMTSEEVGFKPSEVHMWRSPVIPLVDTFGRAETEFAAALMVIACVENGDAWRQLTPQQVGLAMRKASEPGGPLHHLRTNPFAPRPDMRALVDGGYAAFFGDPDIAGTPIAFTAKGIDVLRKCIR